MNRPTADDVRSFYDARIDGKLRDFTHSNPRIEAAIKTLEEWAPLKPKRVLEIGCGIGATSWRMARAWPETQVVGADISEESIRVAQRCFQLPNLRYQAGLVTPDSLHGKFDFIVLMDVYEHIAAEERGAIHAAIKAHAEEYCRVLLTFPTPATQARGWANFPDAMQPIDEDITAKEILALANDLDMQMLYYREVGIWSFGDYAHAVVGRFQRLADVEDRYQPTAGWPGVKHKIKKLVRGAEPPQESLGHDLLRGSSGPSRFAVSQRERLELAERWANAQTPK